MRSIHQYWDERKTDGIVLFNTEDREKFGFSSPVYGEMLEPGIQKVLSETGENKGVFVDLGSGKGHLVTYVGLNYGYTKCVGVELATARYRIGKEIFHSLPFDVPNVSFHNGDIFDYDISSADTIFCNNCAFSPEANLSLLKKINREIKPDAYYVTTSSRFVNEAGSRLEFVTRIKAATSWMNECPVVIYKGVSI